MLTKLFPFLPDVCFVVSDLTVESDGFGFDRRLYREFPLLTGAILCLVFNFSFKLTCPQLEPQELVHDSQTESSPEEDSSSVIGNFSIGLLSVFENGVLKNDTVLLKKTFFHGLLSNFPPVTTQ